MLKRINSFLNIFEGFFYRIVVSILVLLFLPLILVLFIFNIISINSFIEENDESQHE